MLCLLLRRGVQSLLRPADLRQGKRLGKNDRLFVWLWSRRCWTPKSTRLRNWPPYNAERWRVELWFRDIKTSMGMEVLRCKTPMMVHKELEMFFAAYNLTRCLVAQASSRHDVAMGWLSIKGSVDSVRQFAGALAQARSCHQRKQLLAKLLEVIARDRLPERSGRHEPRAVKRRPKPYPLLKRPRKRFKELPHRNRCWNNHPRKSRG